MIPVWRARTTAGLLAACAVGLLLSLGLPETWPTQIWAPLWRSTLQASLSATASCLMGLLLAYAAHHAGPGLKPKGWLAVFNTLPVMPTLVVVLMLLAAYGRNGAMAQAGLPLGTVLYGLGGIVLAHCFINAPWVMQQLLSQWQDITLERRRLVAQLGVRGVRAFYLLYWPLINETLRRQWLLVFLLCFTSFAVVLVFAGSPKWATLEVRLYQLITLEFDLAGATSLAWAQLLALVPLMIWLNRAGPSVVALGRVSSGPVSVFWSWVWGLLSVIWAVPILALLWRASQVDYAKLLDSDAVQQAILTSVWVATLSASAAVMLAWSLARAPSQRWISLSGLLYFLIPSQVMALALFLLFRRTGFGHPAMAVIFSNALMCIPFVLSVLLPAIRRYPQDRLMSSLRLSPSTRFVRIHWPRHRRVLVWAWVFCFGLSLGDFGVVALFGSQDFLTLPYLLYQKLGSYRTQDAYGLAMLIWGALGLMFYYAARWRNHAAC